MLTSFADDEALFASIMAGAAGYVLKQICGDELVRAIRAVGPGQSLLDPAVTKGWPRRRSRTMSPAGVYLSSPATRLMVVARMTAPSRYDSRAWRSAAARKAEVWSAVSDTWKVIPTVKAR
jgi:DNA-binding NarL/FixJ family response regulator